MKIRKALLVYTIPKNKKELATLSAIRNTLKRHAIRFIHVERFSLKKKHFKGMDMVFTLGGDGTFLRASHFVDGKILFFGVNLDVKNKEGFFTIANEKDFEKKLALVEKDRFQIRKLERVQAFIDGKKVAEPALNEYYIASNIPYHTARYFLKVKGKKELQKSSGILVSTPAGSYAWAKSAGGSELPLFSRQFEYVIREPYCGRIVTKCSMRQGILGPKERITIEFEFGKGIIMADSTANEHYFKAGQKVVVQLSDKPLSVIRFD